MNSFFFFTLSSFRTKSISQLLILKANAKRSFQSQRAYYENLKGVYRKGLILERDLRYNHKSKQTTNFEKKMSIFVLMYSE